MADYRLYFLGGDGTVSRAEWLEASSDDEAVVLARLKRSEFDSEVWQRNRKVSTITGREEKSSGSGRFVSLADEATDEQIRRSIQHFGA
jgi:hypothetical protein